MSLTIHILFPICVVVVIHLCTRRLSRNQEKHASQSNRQPLEVLYSPALNDPEVDIVAVHGLGSNVDWSWIWQDKTRQRSRVHWLKDLDMLPAIVPNARILAYNYESRWHADAPQTRLQLCCETLVQSLDSFRDQESKRPILFIGHSLGGLVILYGLSYAHSQLQFKYLPDNTIGFISLGTPFRGTDMQPIAQLAAWIMAPFGSHWGVIADLGYDSATLRDEIHKFGDIVKKLNISTYCFFEQFKTDYGKRFGVPGIIKGMVVKEASACVPAWPRASLQTDHLKMNKFAGPNDRGFLAVSAEISKMCKVEEPLFKQAIQYLRDKCYTESKLRITRLSGAILSIDQCYINLAIVENAYADKSSEDASDQSSPFSFLARQKIETPNEKLQVNLADIFNSRGESNVPGNPPRRIFIRGRAGVGKTTLCKKIVHDFNQSTIWKDLFACILWVPLRNLKGRKGSGYNLEKLLFDEFFAYSGNELGQRFTREIDTMRHHRGVLFILDGWDEVAQLDETDHDMFMFLEQLLGLPNVIITSRPSASLPPGINVHLELETIGFYPEQVDEYIINSHTQYADEIKSYLQDHQLVRSLARIPIQLDALCHCWKDIKANYGYAKQQTMTSLYQAIQTSLWKKDIPNLRPGGKDIQSSDVKSADQVRIENLVQDQLYFLEHLAFDGLINNIFEFELKHLNPVNNDSNCPLFLDSMLSHSSFLRTSNSAAQYSDQSYHFIHLTFQEYFAARYFVRHWTLRFDLKSLLSDEWKCLKPTNFLAKNKYDQRFNVMWRFAAGLLDVLDDKGEQHATHFLKEIEKKPRDLLGPAHQRLVMHCLSEVVSSGGLGFSTYKANLEEVLARWMYIECEVNGESLLAAEPEFPEKALEKGLKQGSEKTRRAIVDALARRRAPHAVLSAAVSCLVDNSLSKDTKQHILYKLQYLNIPLTKNHIQSVATQLEENKELRQSAWSILLSQPILSRDLIEFIMAKIEKEFKKEDMSLRPRILVLMAEYSALTKEALRLATAQLEDSTLPQDIRQLAAAQLQHQSSDLIEGISLEVERFSTSDQSLEPRLHELKELHRKLLIIRDVSHLRQTALQILREHSVYPIQKFLWLEVQLRACDRIDRALRSDRRLSHKNEVYQMLLSNEKLADEVLHILQKLDLSKEALLLVAKQLKADGNVINHRVLQILGNWSDLSNEVLLLVVKQLKCDNHAVANESLQILRSQSNLSKKVLHAVAELFTLQLHSDEKQEEAASFLPKQPVSPEEVLCMVKEWQEKRDLSRQIGIFHVPEGQSSLSRDTLLSVVSNLRSNEARTRQSAIKSLNGRSTIPKDVVNFLAQELKDTTYQIDQTAAEVLKCQAALSDRIIQLIAERLRNKHKWAKAAVKALSSQANLPRDMVELIAEQLEDTDITIKQAAAEILKCQAALSDRIIQRIAEQLRNKDKRAKAAAVKALGSQTTLSKTMLQSIPEQLKDTDYEMNQAAAEAFKCSGLPSDEMLQYIVNQFQNESFHTRAASIKVFRSRTNLSQELLERIARQLMDQTLETQESGLYVLANGNTSDLSERMIQIPEAQLDIGATKGLILNSILKILASQSALSKRTLLLVARQLNSFDESAQKAVAAFLKHQPVPPVEVLEFLGRVVGDGKIGRKEAAEILKSNSSLPDSVLRLVERQLYAKRRMYLDTWLYLGTWSETLQILKAQSVLSEERQRSIVGSLRTRNHNFQREVVETLFSRPHLYTGVLEMHLLSFYEALLRRSFSEHLVWISQDSGSYLVKDSRHISWDKIVSSKRELELVQEVQKSLYAEWEMPDKNPSWMALWYPHQEL